MFFNVKKVICSTVKFYFYLPTPFPVSIDTGKENYNCQSMNIKKDLV